MENRGSQLLKAVFDTDNFWMRGCEKILDLAAVNLLFLLSCLPVFTIGIAKISLYQTLFAVKGSRRVKLAATYSRALKENWKLGLQLGLLEEAIVAISVFDLLLIWNQEAVPFQLLKAVCLGLLIFTVLIFLCAYPLASRFELTFQEILQTSLLLVSLNFPWFFLMLAVLTAVCFLCISSGLALVLGACLFLLIGFAAFAFGQIGMLEKIFHKYEMYKLEK
ncbi:YesL family protein [Streptococcus panodentis]|uniref:DUF624 domain-containing protein n=1 Tax=Streptococcus panodentis TaxID=1581472 RepID=A0ABS5AWQ5_9STRE|nr:DUF624 domain-containing protein [Streptococcus panodentis]MBP2621009.1 hypothetical protein [Streptococcus panodentis]